MALSAVELSTLIAACAAKELEILQSGVEGQIGGRRWKDEALREVRSARAGYEAELAALNVTSTGQGRLYTARPR